MSDVIEFYNNLSEDYHLMFLNWEDAIRYQSNTIDSLINKHLPRDKNQIKLLDCSCGIGTQAIGLAILGYKVVATDLSETAVARCKQEADRARANMECGVADFRFLEKQVTGVFDCVISFDNSLPHLLTRQDLHLGIKNIYNKLDNNGVFFGSTRDYDSILEKKTRVQMPYVHDEIDGRRITLQTWDWSDDNTYKVNLYLIKHQGAKCITDYYSTMYKAWKRGEMIEIMQECGFKNIEWHMPKDTGYYQPIVSGFK